MAKIFIDAGHGGSDPGAVNTSLGIHEADINLDVALKLGDVLESIGHTIRYSRSTNVFVSLNNRAKMANDWGANYFISIHCNSSENKSANGTETLYYRDATSSAWLAEDIQIALIKAISLTDRGIKPRNLAVLRLTRMPAVLVELAFISNNTEAQLLVNPTFQQDCADGIALGIQTFLS